MALRKLRAFLKKPTVTRINKAKTIGPSKAIRDIKAFGYGIGKRK